MATPLFGNTSYGPTQPSSQGAQGPQGANQIKQPQDIGAQQYRSPNWTPAPASSSERGAGAGSRSSPQRYQQLDQTNTGGSPVMPNGMIAPPSAMATSGMQQPSGSQPPAPAGQPNTAPGLLPYQGQGSGQTPVNAGNEAQYGVPTDEAQRQQFYARLAPGQPVQGQPGMTWGHGPQGWYVTGQGQQPGAQGPGAQPNPALYSPYGPYPGRPDGTVYQPGQQPQFNFGSYQTAQFNQQVPQGAIYQPGQLPSGQMPTYQAGQIGQFNAPNLSGLESQQDALLQQVMNNPGLSPAAINAMKERSKSQTLAMSQQLGQQAAQRGAATGMTGLAGADQRNIGNAAMSSIMGGYRDIDIAAADRAQSDRLNALQASEALASGRGNRASQFYQTGLQGQMAQQELLRAQNASEQAAAQFGLQRGIAQEGLNQAGADSAFRATQFNAQQQGLQADENFRAWQSQFQPAQFAADQAYRQEQLNQAGSESALNAYRTDVDAFNSWKDNLARDRQLDIQQNLGQGGLDIDRQRLAQQGSQFDRSLQLDWASLLNNMYMGRAGLGLDYASLQQQGQNTMMNQILGLVPRG